jgi:hypothetical protein
VPKPFESLNTSQNTHHTLFIWTIIKGLARASFFDTVFLAWFFSPKFLKFASFPFSFGARVCLASVSVDDVRDVINVSSAEVPDAKVLKMIKHAEVTLELETRKEIDYSNYTYVDKGFKFKVLL